MATTKVDLQSFCQIGDSYRSEIAEPFSHGAYTYATNGHIMIRVPAVSGMSGHPKAPRAGAARIFDAVMRDGRLTEVGKVSLPRARSDDKRIVQIAGIYFQIKYVRMLVSLRGLRLPTRRIPDSEPMPFAFNGGEGALMPVRHEAYDADQRLDGLFGQCSAPATLARKRPARAALSAGAAQ